MEAQAAARDEENHNAEALRGVRGRLSRSWRSLSRSLTNVNRGAPGSDDHEIGRTLMAERIAARKAPANSKADAGQKAKPHTAGGPVRLDGENMPPPAAAAAKTNRGHSERDAAAKASQPTLPSTNPATASKLRGRSRSRLIGDNQEAVVLHVATDQPPRTRSTSAGRLRQSLSRSLSNLRDRARRARSRSAGRRRPDTDGEDHSGISVDGPAIRVGERNRDRSLSPGKRVPPSMPATGMFSFGTPYQATSSSPTRSLSSMEAISDNYSTRLPRSGSPVRSVVTDVNNASVQQGRQHTFSHPESDLLSPAQSTCQVGRSAVSAAETDASGNRVHCVELGGVDKREQELGPLPMGWDMCVDESGNEYFVNLETLATQWIDPRLERVHNENKGSSDDLPFGWDVCYEPGIGTFYVDHLNKRTTFEHPRQKQHGALQPPPTKLVLSKERLYTRTATDVALGRGSGSRASSAAGSIAGASSHAPVEAGWTRLVCRLQRPYEGGFGFLVQGTYPSKMTVQKVFPEGPAQGVLQVDDHIALVNGINTISMTYDMLLELLQRIPRGDYVTFTVLRPDRDDARSMRSRANSTASLATTTRSGMERHFVILEKVAGQGYGFALYYDEETDSHRVRHIQSGSIADKPGHLHVGDRIIKVNGTDVCNSDHEEVVLLVKTKPFSVALVVEREATLPLGDSSFQVAEIRRSMMLAIQGLRNKLMVLDQSRRLTMARYSSLGGELAALIGSPTQKKEASPQQALAAAHLQAISLVLRAINSQVTHLEQCCAELAIDEMDAVQVHETATFTDWCARLDCAQVRRHQLVLEYKALLRTLPSCVAIYTEEHTIELERGHVDDGFGFTVVGGSGASMPPTIIGVQDDGPAAATGLAFGDRILRINHYDVRQMTHAEVTSAIKTSLNPMHIVVERAVERPAPFEFPPQFACPQTDTDDVVGTVNAMERCRQETELETVLARDLTVAIRQELQRQQAGASAAPPARTRWFQYEADDCVVLRLLRESAPGAEQDLFVA